jgi:hypothetical protein
MRRPHDPQLVVPENLVVRVLYVCHGDKTGGHFGRDKTMSRVSQHFYWPAMAMAVSAYVQSCAKCAAQKNPPARTCLPLHPLTIPCKPFVQITMDHKHSVRDGKGYKYALMFVDYFTKCVAHFVGRGDGGASGQAHVSFWCVRYCSKMFYFYSLADYAYSRITHLLCKVIIAIVFERFSLQTPFPVRPEITC